MKKKYKFTFYINHLTIASCVVNVAQKAAFERLMNSMVRYSSVHNYNVQFDITEIEVEK